MLQNKKNLTYLFEKFEKNYNGAYGKFENSLNCHNFGCVQIES